MNQSIVPPGFVAHLPVIEREVEPGPFEAGAPWVSDTVYEVRGANLCDPVSDPLPGLGSASVDDATPCGGECTGLPCDQDEDGHPGMTSLLSGVMNCTVYTAQRWWTRLGGAVVDADRIAGAITETFSEQQTIGASKPLCEFDGTGAASEECPEHQYFAMVRLADGADCEDVLALTDCDEDETTCDTNAALPLDPADDQPGDCE